MRFLNAFLNAFLNVNFTNSLKIKSYNFNYFKILKPKIHKKLTLSETIIPKRGINEK
jgi:hypothetical protein